MTWFKVFQNCCLDLDISFVLFMLYTCLESNIFYAHCLVGESCYWFGCYMQEPMANLSAEALSEYEQIVSKWFCSEEEGFQFYNNYALEKGFSVRKCYVEWDNGNQ